MATPCQLLTLLPGGLLAGALGGMLGIGGGIVLMPVLRFGVGLPPALSAGTCILAVFFTTLGGSYRHYQLGHVELRPIIPVIVSGALACGLFSLLFSYLAPRGHWLDLGVGLVFSMISARMIAEGIPGLVKQKTAAATGGAIRGPLPHKIGIGAAAGVLPGLLGIGTGGVLVPAFTFILGAPIKRAMAASLVCFCFNALISATFKAAQGFIDLQVALPICVGTLIGSNLGALLNRRCSSAVVRVLFGLVFACVALKFILSFAGVYL